LMFDHVHQSEPHHTKPQIEVKKELHLQTLIIL
jgi:hypothetical protein